LSAIAFLGHIISAEGVRPNPKKLEVLHDWPIPDGFGDTPRAKSELRSFIGLANFFRKFAFRYTQTIKPLLRLLQEDVPWQWGPQEQTAWEAVKALLTEDAVLATPNSREPFDVVVDASDYAVGGVLLQGGKIVAFEGRKLTDQERKYGTGEKELLAAKYCMEQWACYLQGSQAPFTLYTDHNPNTFFQTKTNLSPRQMRWYEDIAQFDFEWKYKRGTVNEADAISRAPQFQPPKSNNVTAGAVINSISAAANLQVVQGQGMEEVEPEAPTPEADDEEPNATVIEPALEDTAVSIRQRLAQQKDNAWFKTHNPKHHAWTLDNDRGLWLTELKQVVVPDVPDIRQDILFAYHHSLFGAHQSAKRTYGVIGARYYWPGLKTDVERFVRGCVSCQRQKPDKGIRAPTQAINNPDRPWATLHVDFITCLPQTSNGNDALVVFVDKLTRMVHLVPFRREGFTSAEFGKVFVQEIVRLHGVPDTIISDRDPLFGSTWWQQVTNDLKIHHHMSTAFHPQTDGTTEKMNDVVESALRHYTNESGSDWDQFLAGVEFALNNSICEATRISPFRFNYGYSPKMPLDVERTEGSVPNARNVANALKQRVVVAKEYITQAQERYTKPGHTIPQYQVGEWVWLSTKNFRKDFQQGKHLAPRNIGPFKITHRRGKVAYTLDIPNTRKHTTFHYDLLKKHVGPPPAHIITPPATVEDTLSAGYYPVERILAHKYDKRTLKFLIKWQNCPDEMNEWVSQSRVTEEAKNEYKRTPEYLACKDKIQQEQAEREAKAQAQQQPQPARHEQPALRRSARTAARVNTFTGNTSDSKPGPIFVYQIQTFLTRLRDQLTRH
jgi:hypothetical protein